MVVGKILAHEYGDRGGVESGGHIGLHRCDVRHRKDGRNRRTDDAIQGH